MSAITNRSREQRGSYLIELAQVLIYLRGATIGLVATAIGVSEASVRDFLSRTRLSLAPEHAVKFFYYLGIGRNKDGETGLLSHCVHHYTIDLSRAGATVAMDIIRPLFAQAQAEATLLPYCDGRTQVALIKTPTARVVLRIKTGLMQRRLANLSPVGLAECEVPYLAGECDIPAEYRPAVYSGQIGLVDFDALFGAAFPDWHTIRRVANSHNITYSEIIHFMKERSRTSRGLTYKDYKGLAMISGRDNHRGLGQQEHRRRGGERDNNHKQIEAAG